MNAVITKKELDIKHFIDEIRNIASDHRIVNDKNEYWGKISLCFEKGEITYIERQEKIK